MNLKFYKCDVVLNMDHMCEMINSHPKYHSLYKGKYKVNNHLSGGAKM